MIQVMYTIIESELFTRKARNLWTEDDRGEFCSWLIENTEAGDVVTGSGGCRKVRWKRAGTGKSGGVRVIYLNRLPSGVIYLLTIYAKSVRGSIPAHILKSIAEEAENV